MTEEAGKAELPPEEQEAEAGSGAATAEDLERLQAEADENRERYLRTAAELENLRKRSAREVENARQFGIERFAGELLGVVDSLEMGVAAGEEASAEALLEGSQATLRQITATLEKFGVAVVDPLGEPSETAEPDSVLTVVQRGYTLNGRLLRPARVIVAAAVPASEADA